MAALVLPTVTVVKTSVSVVVPDRRVRVTFVRMTRVRLIVSGAAETELDRFVVRVSVLLESHAWLVSGPVGRTVSPSDTAAPSHNVDCNVSEEFGACVRAKTTLLVSVLTPVALCVPALLLLDQVAGAPLVQAVPAMLVGDEDEFDESGKPTELSTGAEVEPCLSPDDALVADWGDTRGVNVTVLVSTRAPPAVP